MTSSIPLLDTPYAHTKHRGIDAHIVPQPHTPFPLACPPSPTLIARAAWTICTKHYYFVMPLATHTPYDMYPAVMHNFEIDVSSK